MNAMGINFNRVMKCIWVQNHGRNVTKISSNSLKNESCICHCFRNDLWDPKIHLVNSIVHLWKSNVQSKLLLSVDRNNKIKVITLNKSNIQEWQRIYWNVPSTVMLILINKLIKIKCKHVKWMVKSYEIWLPLKCVVVKSSLQVMCNRKVTWDGGC